MALNSAEFHDLIDAAQNAVEDVLDDSDLDVDVENAGGVLTLRFANRSQVILSRQEALGQLWVAARSGGFHLNYDDSAARWYCPASDEALGELLSRVVEEQTGEQLDFANL
ncbi:iron donor protein CyaY [Atopomonas hussainii]|uniref:iron donor protein CyaY n=1 Tax=Atopomonas hussainii TaxID=1429083 RepID=UPI00090049C9|nr:iron donor protein CyaY [Atopomonas hussainii]